MSLYHMSDDPSYGGSLSNQAPQMYNDFDDGSGQYGYYGQDQDGDDGGGADGADGGNDNTDAKRRRIARACDMCRKKKIKCDGKMPACSHCINYKTECIFTQVEKKRNPPKGAKYIEGLENRLGRMESLLKLSGLLGEDDDKVDLGTLEKRLADQKKQQNGIEAAAAEKRAESTESPSRGNDGKESRKASVAEVKPKEESHPPEKNPGEVEALSDMMCSLVTTNAGETRYIGSSSGFSIFSPKGIQWVNDKTGEDSFQHMMTEANTDNGKWTYWKPEIFGDIFTRRIFRPLPPLTETLSLLRDYFENFNCMFPLFHEPTFMHLVRRQYSRDPYTGSGWWASLNIALAIAHRLRVMSNLVPQDEDQKAWGHLKNALGVMAELTMRNTDLLSVQALLGMALFLKGTPNPQPSFLLVASAIRLAHSIGLHKKGSTFNLSTAEAEQRKRVFWIGYMLDKDTCLRSGRPPAQDDDDMNVELPSEDPSDNIGNIPMSDGKGKVNLFRLMCEFAQIESRVYNRLYSTKAAKQTDGELLNTIGELDKELEEWKDGIPPDFRPENEIKASHTPLILHVVVLHFAYYNCLTTIHRMSCHHGYWTSRLSNYAIQGLNARPLNPRVFSSATLCVQAARASIHLIKYIPQGDYASVWMIIYYPVSAVVTLFANVLQNPQDPRVRSDIRLMHQVVSFLSVLAVDEETGGVKRMLEVCIEFERLAKIVLEKSDKVSRKRRKPGDDEEPKPRNAPGRSPKSAGQPTSPSTTFSPTKSNEPKSVDNPLSTSSDPGDAALSPDDSLGGGSASVVGSGGGGGGNGALQNGAPQPISAGSLQGGPFSPRTELGMLPEYVPRPGDFPNMLTEFSDMGAGGQFAPGGAASPLNVHNPHGTNGAAAAHAGFAQPMPPIPHDLWQMPMNFEWDWNSMAQGAFAADAEQQQQARERASKG